VPLLKEKVRCASLLSLAIPIPMLVATSCLGDHAALLDNRKLRIKRSIKVPAISNKVADIPPDEYSWRKYGQKPIKGSPHPRYVRYELEQEMFS
jgi:hypothetical protein